MRAEACLVVVAAALASACAPARVDMAYAPSDAPELLRAARMPKLFLAGVDDRTAGGFVYNGVGATKTGQLTRPAADSVAEALRLELRRDGVPLVAARSESDAVLKVAVTAITESIQAGMNVPLIATLGVSLQLRSLSGDLLWSNELSGRGSRNVSTPGLPGEAATLAMNAALADVMRKVRDEFEQDGVLDRPFRAAATASAAAVAAPSGARAAPASDLDELPVRRPEQKAYAVVIGVERYREKLPNADFAANDARLTAEYFERLLGVPHANVVLLIDERATKGDFEKYIERWLPNHVEKGDAVYVYYSGHGAPNPAKGEAFLVPYDADPTYIDQTGYSVKRLLDELSKLPARHVYVAMDSCFSGAGGRSVIAKGSRPLVTIARSDVPANMTVISASAGEQISGTDQEKGHGLFTYYFLKGLKEKGGDLLAAFEFLKPEVSRVALRDDNTVQVPQWREGR